MKDEIPHEQLMLGNKTQSMKYEDTGINLLDDV